MGREVACFGLPPVASRPHRLILTNGAKSVVAMVALSVRSLRTGPDYFRDIAAVLDAAGGPPDFAALTEVMRRHGLALVR